MYRLVRTLLFALAASACAALLTFPTTASAQGQIGSGKDIGLGLGRGTLTSGITGKFYLDQSSAVQLYLGNLGGWYDRGYDCRGSCGLALSGDYIFEFEDLVNEDVGRLFLGGGGGAFLYNYGTFGRYASGYSGVGVHGVFELGWHFNEFPLEIAIDIRPAFDFVSPPFDDHSPFFIDGGGSIRIFF
jgi:hypothetical protein